MLGTTSHLLLPLAFPATCCSHPSPTRSVFSFPAGGSLEGALHAAAMQPDATWAGWVQPPKAKLLPKKAAPQFNLQSKLSQSTDSDDEVATLTRDLTAADPLADADRLVSPQARWAGQGVASRLALQECGGWYGGCWLNCGLAAAAICRAL